MSDPLKIDGVEILVEGGGAETLVMVHGWPDTYRLWDRQAQALQAHYRCVRFTLPGFDAAHERRARSLDELVDFLRRVVETVAPDRKVILMLHDWGCVFGYQFYLRHPQRVSRIVGVDIGDSQSLGRELRLKAALMILAYQTWLALAWSIGGTAGGGALGDRMTRYMARRARCPSPMALVGSRMTYPYFMFWFGGGRAYKRQIKPFKPACPTLFIYARRKPFMFHAQGWLDWLRAQPGSEVVEFDTGHWVMSEQPERFNQVVSGWLAR